MNGVNLSALALLPRESTRRDELEAVIERGLNTFVEVGGALMEIRDTRLYRDTHGTFEHYCRQRWGMSRIHAFRMIESAEVVHNLLPIGNILPANEAQVRPLTRLEPEHQREAWDQAVETAPKDEIGEPRITAANVENIVREIEGRQKLSVHYSSESPEWYTPKSIIDAVIALFGAIDLDPCSNSKEAPNVCAAHHFTESDNGLQQKWFGKVYMNPPYGTEISNWIEKLLAELDAGNVNEAIALVPARTDTQWFREFRDHPRCFVNGRLNFSGFANSAPFPSAVIYLGQRVNEFAAAFASLGDTYVRIA